MNDAPALALLGVVRAARPGCAAILRGNQAQQVLAFLVLADGRAVPRAELAAVVWPDGRSAHWEGALRGLVAKARAFLRECGPGAPAIEAVGDALRCACPDRSGVDVWFADVLAARAEAALAADDPGSAATDAERVVELLGGPLLPAVDAGWLLPWRSVLHRRRLVARRVAALARSAHGDHEQALAHAESARADDPLDDENHLAVMDAHTAAGNVAAALRAYADCRQVLRDEVGARPGPAVEARYVELLALDAATPTGPTGPTAVAASVRRAVRPFVGREAELAILRAAFDRSVGTQGIELVVLHGEAGVGTTRLALEAARSLAPDRFGVGRCPPGPLAPFEPFVEALGLGLGSTVTPAHVHERLGSPAGSVLVLDDVHRADTASRGLLDELIAAPGGPLLLIATTGGGDLPSASAEIHVPSLAIDEVAALAPGLGDADLAVVHERTRGNAFLATQLLGAIDDGERAAEALPRSVLDVVRHRRAQLPPEANAVLAFAALLDARFGAPVAAADLAAAGGTDEVVERLVRAGFLVPVGEETWAFAHPIARDAVVALLGYAERRRLHRLVAPT